MRSSGPRISSSTIRLYHLGPLPRPHGDLIHPVRPLSLPPLNDSSRRYRRVSAGSMDLFVYILNSVGCPRSLLLNVDHVVVEHAGPGAAYGDAKAEALGEGPAAGRDHLVVPAEDAAMNFSVSAESAARCQDCEPRDRSQQRLGLASVGAPRLARRPMLSQSHDSLPVQRLEPVSHDPPPPASESAFALVHLLVRSDGGSRKAASAAVLEREKKSERDRTRS